jgi:hypothetical protein
VSIPFEILPIRFEGTSFTREQTERLQALAGLSSLEGAVVHAGGISSLLEITKPFLRSRSSRAEQDALRRLEKISKLARELANLLEIEPASDFFVRPDTLNLVDGASVSDFRAEVEGARDEFIKRLRQVEHRAVQFQKDRISHRIGLGLVPNPSDQRNPEVALLWPALFKHWELYFGREVAKTENGPLHSFVNLVHEVLGLDPAAHRTFRDAVDRWKNEERDRWKDEHTRLKEDLPLWLEENDESEPEE